MLHDECILFAFINHFFPHLIWQDCVALQCWSKLHFAGDLSHRRGHVRRKDTILMS
ncbi:hypothetical protein BC830DRAFT_1118403 [Chytriomyces sp. MP71]|nr:hypothetical protein BC830DRAFT_1118403 [Chytriomyces sp. MP71]